MNKIDTIYNQFKKETQFGTDLGNFILSNSEKLLSGSLGKTLEKSVQLILTSPPFPLNKRKKYGNRNGDEYKKWFSKLSEIYSKLLTDNGSIVIELGNAWEPGRPVESLLPLESLLEFVNNSNANLKLCQEFICYNPSRLPSPAQWVTIERERVTDSYTRIWWMSKSDHPKADNRRVLRPYSQNMKDLLKRQSYNAGKRPSEHKIGEKSFLKDNEGSIPHNFFEIEPLDPNRKVRLPNVFSIANNSSNDFFSKTCRERGITLHPARMPEELAYFFIEFLTDPGDIVLDPFAGSNTTGFCAESRGRSWISIEINKDYGEQSMIRFENPKVTVNLRKNLLEESNGI